VLGQRGYVSRPVTQRRQRDRDHVEPIVQVVSELAGQAFDGITTVEQFVTAKAHLGFGLQTSQHLRIGTELSLAHDTEHFISTADVGKDLNGTGIVESRADGNWSAEEQNPTYVRSIDALGRRLRVEETTVFNVRMSATLMF
jgi:hypothetical protein